MITKFRADLGLLSVTFFWGTTFILSKQLLEHVPLPIFLFLRLSIAAVVLNIYTLRFRRDWNRQVLLDGFILGVFLYLSYFFQMWGIQYTSASNAGFITGLSVVLVPIFGFLFFRYQPPFNILFGVIFAVAGLLLLTGANPFNWNAGDLLVLICAVTVAFHIIYTGRFAPRNNVYLLTTVQLSVMAIFTMFALLISDYQWPEISGTSWWVLVYLGLFGTVYAFLMQTAMQRYTTTARTALIFAMEPVFATLFAFLIAGEQLTFSGWIGGLLIVLGMITAEIPFLDMLKKNNN